MPGLALTITRAVEAGDGAAAIAESTRLQPLFDLFAQHGGSLRVIAAIAEDDALPSMLGMHGEAVEMGSPPVPSGDDGSDHVMTALGDDHCLGVSLNQPTSRLL